VATPLKRETPLKRDATPEKNNQCEEVPFMNQNADNNGGIEKVS
jgi:hypothetical protein